MQHAGQAILSKKYNIPGSDHRSLFLSQCIHDVPTLPALDISTKTNCSICSDTSLLQTERITKNLEYRFEGKISVYSQFWIENIQKGLGKNEHAVLKKIYDVLELMLRVESLVDYNQNVASRCGKPIGTKIPRKWARPSRPSGLLCEPTFTSIAAAAWSAQVFNSDFFMKKIYKEVTNKCISKSPTPETNPRKLGDW